MSFASARVLLQRPSTLGCLLSISPLTNHHSSIPRQKSTMASAENNQTAIFASGCFWGTEHIFRQHFGDGKGLLDAKVGYTGGSVHNPTYKQVCTGTTQHAESVKIEFDPNVVSYSNLVEHVGTQFYRTHDASHYNHQGPDRGTQYRSAIFYLDDHQRQVAETVTKEIEEKYYKPKGKKIVSVIEKFEKWWDAEDYHQNYLHKNPHGYECPTHRLHW